MDAKRAIFQFRRGTTTQWEDANPTLLEGEIGLELTTANLYIMKVGDGIRNWENLPRLTLEAAPYEPSRNDLVTLIGDVTTLQPGLMSSEMLEKLTGISSNELLAKLAEQNTFSETQFFESGVVSTVAYQGEEADVEAFTPAVHKFSHITGGYFPATTFFQLTLPDLTVNDPSVDVEDIVSKLWIKLTVSDVSGNGRFREIAVYANGINDNRVADADWGSAANVVTCLKSLGAEDSEDWIELHFTRDAVDNGKLRLECNMRDAADIVVLVDEVGLIGYRDFSYWQNVDDYVLEAIADYSTHTDESGAGYFKQIVYPGASTGGVQRISGQKTFEDLLVVQPAQVPTRDSNRLLTSDDILNNLLLVPTSVEFCDVDTLVPDGDQSVVYDLYLTPSATSVKTLTLPAPSETYKSGRIVVARVAHPSYTTEGQPAAWALSGHINGVAGNTEFSTNPVASAILISDGTTWNVLSVSYPQFVGTSTEYLPNKEGTKTTPIAGDSILLEDSEDGGAVKSSLVSAFPFVPIAPSEKIDPIEADQLYIKDSIDGLTKVIDISSLETGLQIPTEEKTTPIAADSILLEDSEDGGAVKSSLVSAFPYVPVAPSEKLDPVDEDQLYIKDSTDGLVKVIAISSLETGLQIPTEEKTTANAADTFLIIDSEDAGEVKVISAANLPAGSIPDNSITNAKFAQVPYGTIKGRLSVGTGDVEDLTLEDVADAILGSGTLAFVNSVNGYTGNVVLDYDDVATENSIPNADLVQVASGTIKGRLTAEAGNVEDITLEALGTALGVGDVSTCLLKLEHQATSTSFTAAAWKSYVVDATAADVEATLPSLAGGALESSLVSFRVGAGTNNLIFKTELSDIVTPAGTVNGVDTFTLGSVGSIAVFLATDNKWVMLTANTHGVTPPTAADDKRYATTEWVRDVASIFGAVTSVAGKTGAVTLDAADIAETETLKIFTSDERSKLTGIEAGAEVNDVTSVAGKTGAVTLDASDIVETETLKILTATERTKLTGIEEGAEVNDVTSVAGKTGAVTLDASDIAETETLKILTADERTKLTGIEEGAEVNDVTSVAGRTGAVTLGISDVADLSTTLSSIESKWSYSFHASGTVTGVANTIHGFNVTGTLNLPLVSSVGIGGRVGLYILGSGAAITVNTAESNYLYLTTSTSTTFTATTRGTFMVFIAVNSNSWIAEGSISYLTTDTAQDITGQKTFKTAFITNPDTTSNYSAFSIGSSPGGLYWYLQYQPSTKKLAWFTEKSGLYPKPLEFEYDPEVRAVLNNASLTGVSIAPTAAPGTATTQIANTAFVDAAVTRGMALVNVVEINSSTTTSITLSNASHHGKILELDTTTADIDVYLPNSTTDATIGSSKFSTTIMNVGSNTVNIYPQVGVTFGAKGTQLAYIWDSATIYVKSNNVFRGVGSLI